MPRTRTRRDGDRRCRGLRERGHRQRRRRPLEPGRRPRRGGRLQLRGHDANDAHEGGRDRAERDPTARHSVRDRRDLRGTARRPDVHAAIDCYRPAARRSPGPGAPGRRRRALGSGCRLRVGVGDESGFRLAWPLVEHRLRSARPDRVGARDRCRHGDDLPASLRRRVAAHRREQLLGRARQRCRVVRAPAPTRWIGGSGLPRARPAPWVRGGRSWRDRLASVGTGRGHARACVEGGTAGTGVGLRVALEADGPEGLLQRKHRHVAVGGRCLSRLLLVARRCRRDRCTHGSEPALVRRTGGRVVVRPIVCRPVVAARRDLYRHGNAHRRDAVRGDGRGQRDRRPRVRPRRRRRRVAAGLDGGPGDGFYSEAFGEAHRLASGTTLYNYGQVARVLEVTSAGELVWDLAWPTSAFLGLTTPIADLYALR